jgi:hypothetical protein
VRDARDNAGVRGICLCVHVSICRHVRTCMSYTHACILRRNGRKHVQHFVQDHRVFNHVRACV